MALPKQQVCFPDGHKGIVVPKDAPTPKQGYYHSEDGKSAITILPFKGHDAYPPDRDGRTRYVRLKWPRHPKGTFLTTPGPSGKRPPNGLLWGHNLDEFLWIDRHPDAKNPLSRSVTVWSRSMIKAWGENYHDEDWELSYNDASPHLRKPWPVLKLRIPVGEHIGDYVFDQQIGEFNQIFESCPKNSIASFSLRRDPYVDSGEPSQAEPTHQSYGDCAVTHDIYRFLLPPSIRENLEGYEFHKQNDYQRQGRTIEYRGAFRACYDYEPYTTPVPHSRAPRDSPFSVEDLPALQEAIPPVFMPDYLIVHDPHHVARSRGSDRTETELPSNAAPPSSYKYQRVFPKIDKEALDVPPACIAHDVVAHLYLHQKNRMGVGHHSLVYRAPLTLPPPLSAISRTGRVTVTAKLALCNTADWRMLKHEAEMYDRFPKHLSDDCCGFVRVAPMPHPVPVGPVVPNFYGYYEPVGEDNQKRSPVLLLEECGRPIEPKRLTIDQRTECLSLMFRLHAAGYIQNSFFIRNILRQPGPLYRPPDERSNDTPSFRIIDFGRAKPLLRDEAGSGSNLEVIEEETLARRELGFTSTGWSYF